MKFSAIKAEIDIVSSDNFHRIVFLHFCKTWFKTRCFFLSKSYYI